MLKVSPTHRETDPPLTNPTPTPQTTPSKMGRRKLAVFWVILFVLLATLFEVSANIGLRILRGYDGEHLYQYVYDPYKNILPTPNFVDTRGVRHNSVGFRRSSEVAVEKPDSTYRIFLMGASTAYGLGSLWTHIQPEYELLDDSETIDAYLEALLNDSLPGHVEVINAAITSTWTHHHLIYLNQTILGYDPDMVLFLDGFNDFFRVERNHDQFATYAYGQPVRVIMGEPTMYSLIYQNAWWLFRKSAAAHVTSRGLQTVYQAVRPVRIQGPMDVDAVMDGFTRSFPATALKMHQRSGLILRTEGVHAVFMLQPLLILERNRPGMTPIERDLFNFNVASYRPDWEEFMHRAVAFVREKEQAMADSVGATFLDVSQPFNGVQDQVYTDYAHLTPLGNRLLAERIAATILGTIRADLQSRTASGR